MYNLSGPRTDLFMPKGNASNKRMENLGTTCFIGNPHCPPPLHTHCIHLLNTTLMINNIYTLYAKNY